MKPNFALSLSFESIRLLHRATGGWRLVGDVSPDATDLSGDLETLRKTATALAPEGLRCKVVIPNDQIRYLTLATPGFNAAESRDAAREALARATPYPVDDLAFDVTRDGDATHVAAVALETLREAEDFAVEHQFCPVSFVAIPADHAFVGEPYFGPARAARALLGPGQTIEPDSVAIVIVGDGDTPQGPVAEAAFDAAPVAVAPAAPPPDPGAFKSTRQIEAEARDNLKDALDSLQPGDTDLAGIAAPDVPSRAVEARSTFTSRRASADAYAGFAEPAKPFAAEPASEARARSVRVPAQGPTSTTARNEADRMTVFGARNARDDDARKRGFPLGLTAALVVVLAGLGTWSFGSLRDTVATWRGAETTTPADITAIGVAPPIVQPPALADGEGTGETDLAAPDIGLSDEDAAVLNALRTPLAENDVPPVQSPDDLRASYAVTGIWSQAPEVPSPSPLVDLEDLYVTSIDPVEPAFDAVALPQVASFDKDIAFDKPGSPAAAGTKFALDNRGLVRPTAQGTPNPDGIQIYAGAPPVRPTAFPVREAEPVVQNPVQTTLAAFRPRTRPGDLVETTERATLDGLTRDELAEFRPPVRPAAVAVVTANASAASLASLDGGAGPLSIPTKSQIAASTAELARAASLRPDARPSNFGQIVARAQRTASSAAAVGAASIAPRAVAPKIPTAASVTREATVKNAINLRRVNLIGVYGTPSSRRALVRLTNGRYKKVQVGDRIDGGRISAIGEGELRYQKSGRNIILKMPKG